MVLSSFRSAREDGFYRCDEAITAAGKCLNVTRSLGIVTQRIPDLLDGEIQSLLEINEGVVAPNLALDLFPRDELALPAGQ